MRPAERDVLLFLLAAASGSADAWSYLGLGHAFVANMTGNTVLTGIAVFQSRDLIHPLLSLCCYCAGAVTAAIFTRKMHPGIVWARPITVTLVVEALIMAAAEAGWVALRLHAAAPPLDLLLGGVAFAVGMQSGAMLQLKVPGVVTTYITGTWTNLMSGIIRFETLRDRETWEQKLSFEERLLLQGGILAVYFLSAVLAGWLFSHHPLAVGAVSAASVIIVALYAAARADSIPVTP